MKIRKVNSLPDKKKSEIGEQIAKFKDSGDRFAELKDWESYYGDRNSGYRSIWVLCKRQNVKLHRRDNRLFLENEEVE